MNKKGQVEFIIFIILFVIIVGSLIIWQSETVNDNGREICASKGEFFYKSIPGAYSNSIVYCKTTEGIINTYIM